jgi:naphthoate synthase
MGAVNAVVPHAELETTAASRGRSASWRRARPRFGCSSTRSTSCDDGLVGQQLFAGEATRLAYQTPEAQEGRDAFLQKRAPDWSGYPWYY